MRAALGHTESGGVFTRQQREISILTIRTGCVGGTTRVCRVRVCLPVCALISHSAAVGGKVKVKGGENVRAAIRSVSESQGRDPT